MPTTISYACDHSGKPCNNADILADATGATQRVILDATIYTRDQSTTPGIVTIKATAMGQHVFASMADALTWAQGVTIT